MNLMASFRGIVRGSLTGADIPGTLRLLNSYGIDLLGCSFVTELEAVITVRRSDYNRAKALCEKRGDTLRLKSRTGAYWTVKALVQRPVLLAGVLFYLLSAIYLPSRVLFVRVVGNTELPDRLILEAAADCGIGFGASRRAVRSEKIKNALLEVVPQLQWAGVNTYGCVAEISVRERALETQPEEEGGFGHIVAGMDGVILSATATQGTLLCAPGQAVTEGQILVSGYTDCGLCIRAEQAKGEIFAATLREITAATSDFGQRTAQAGEQLKKISFLIGKKRINLWKDSGIWDTTCDRMYEEYYITLPGGFQLPFGWSVERYTVREVSPADLDAEAAQQLLSETAQKYLKSQMLSGILRDSEVSFQEAPGIIQMTGQYSCVEMIGFMQRLEIGEKNGENN